MRGNDPRARGRPRLPRRPVSLRRGSRGRGAGLGMGAQVSPRAGAEGAAANSRPELTAPAAQEGGKEGGSEGREGNRAAPKRGRKGPRRRTRGAARGRGGGSCPPTPRPRCSGARRLVQPAAAARPAPAFPTAHSWARGRAATLTPGGTALHALRSAPVLRLSVSHHSSF